MSDNTPRLGLPELAQMQEMDSAQINDALIQIDALGSVFLKGLFVNDPPATPADGDTFVTGAAPTGAWAGNAYKIAYCLDGGWRIFTPFDGLIAHCADTDSPVVYRAGQWTGLGALMAGPEASIASAATCDLGAAGALCVEVTGTTAITSLGSGVNALRFVRFAGALTLTHDAASLVLPGGADIVTAPGDMACFRSDAGGHWRCVCYSRTDGRMVNMDSPVFSGRLGVGMTPVNVLDMVQTANGATMGAILNDSGGSAASARWTASNGTGVAWIGVLGQSFGSFGVYQAGNGMVFASSGLSLTADAGPICFAPNGGSEVARFATDGSFLAGTTTNGGPLGGSKVAFCTTNANALIVSDDGNGVALKKRIASTSGWWEEYYYGSTRKLFTNTDGSAFNINSDIPYQIQVGGSGGVSLASGASSWAAISDARFKNVRTGQTDYRPAIQALWVGDFDWKKDGSFGFGVLAQQAHGVLPEGLRDIVVSKPAQDDGTWTASAEPVGYLALWGVKDLYALVEALAARVARMEVRP